MRRNLLRICSSLLALALFSGCAAPSVIDLEESQLPLASAAGLVQTDQAALPTAALDSEIPAVTGTPALSSQIAPSVVAPGTQVKKNDKAVIDYSNSKDGYVMVQFNAATDKRLKVQVKGPSTTYTYNLTPGQWEAFPLSDGNGSYQISVFQNTTGSKYSCTLSHSISAALADEFAPFLHSNQYVDYDAAPNAQAMAAQLLTGVTKPLDKVAAVYNYVVGSMTYDTAKAATVKSGYLPVLDDVLKVKTGICFDYAALMTGMLRSQGIPCKLVVGYAGTAYHAWISVWSEETGWIDGAIYFDGSTWQRMDPTFASSGKQSAAIMAYIGDGSNYSAKYFY